MGGRGKCGVFCEVYPSGENICLGGSPGGAGRAGQGNLPEVLRTAGAGCRKRKARRRLVFLKVVYKDYTV